jgi:hypothetical protein
VAPTPLTGYFNPEVAANNFSIAFPKEQWSVQLSDSSLNISELHFLRVELLFSVISALYTTASRLNELLYSLQSQDCTVS